MAKTTSWEVTDDFKERVEPLIPLRQRSAEQIYARKSGGGRKPKDARFVFEAICLANGLSMEDAADGALWPRRCSSCPLS